MSDNTKESETGNRTEVAEGFDVIGIRFKPAGKVYLFNKGDMAPEPGTWVVVESDMGLSVGLVVRAKHSIKKSEQPLKNVLRVASEKDLENNARNRSFADEAKVFCIERVKTRELPMKIISTETTLDKKRLTFYFTADGRIDFRELVRDLAARFKTRIEMRQIGVRDEVKLIGGIGSCGREACCKGFLTSFEPVSIRMAKKQELSINQSKLSGICGRLMCCLGYEYEETDTRGPRKRVSAAGSSVPKAAPGAGKTKADSAGKPREKKICSCPKSTCHAKNKGAAVEKKQELPGQSKSGESVKDTTGSKPQDKRKLSGKPFSKRRKFWKKKNKDG
jgi:cell fate regulator YaaT (PSP1 superfamily)